MNRRIGLWTLVGLVVAGCWVAIAAFTPQSYNPGLFWIAAAISAPASLLGRKMPLGAQWFMVLNGGIYAVVGSLIELLRRPLADLRKRA